MSVKHEYRLYTRSGPGDVWERWSGGVKPSIHEWLYVIKADHARRGRHPGGLKPLQYAIQHREVITHPYEIITP